MRYQSKPRPVEAFCFGVDTWPKWFSRAKDAGGIDVIYAEDTFTKDVCVVRSTPPVFCPEGDYLVYSEGVISHQSKQEFEKFHDAVPDEEIIPEDWVRIEVPLTLQSIYGEEVVAEKFPVDGAFVISYSQGLRDNRQAVAEINYRAQEERFNEVVEEVVRKVFDKDSTFEI